MDRIDTHLHLLYPEHFSYEWTAGLPALANQAFRIHDYHAAAGTSTLSEAIHMEVDVPEHQFISEAKFFCTLADDSQHRISGVVAACRPEKGDITETLEQLSHPRLCGYRRVLHTQPDEISTTALFRENIARIGKAGLTFDLCLLPRQLSIGGALIDACPNTRFILDHCGVPDLTTGDLGAWRTQIRAISRRQNLYCKISGIIAYIAAEAHEVDALRPIIEHTIDCFGWARVLWGSDWPVCNLTRDLASWTRCLDEILAESSSTELARLYHLNAREFYQLKPLA